MNNGAWHKFEWLAIIIIPPVFHINVISREQHYSMLYLIYIRTFLDVVSSNQIAISINVRRVSWTLQRYVNPVNLRTATDGFGGKGQEILIIIVYYHNYALKLCANHNNLLSIVIINNFFSFVLRNIFCKRVIYILKTVVRYWKLKA